MSLSDFLIDATRATFVLLGLVTLYEYLRGREPARLDVALFFGSLAYVLGVQEIFVVFGIRPEWAVKSIQLATLAHPYLLLRVLDNLRPIPRRWMQAALGGLALLCGLWLVFVVPPPLVNLASTAYMAVVDGYAVVVLVGGAMVTRGVTRERLRFAALGAGLLAAALLVALADVLLPALAFNSTDIILVLAVCSGLAFYVGFAAPRRVRRLWQLAELERFLNAGQGSPADEPMGAALERLCQAAARAVGGQAAFVATRLGPLAGWSVAAATERPMAEWWMGHWPAGWRQLDTAAEGLPPTGRRRPPLLAGELTPAQPSPLRAGELTPAQPSPLRAGELTPAQPAPPPGGELSPAQPAPPVVERALPARLNGAQDGQPAPAAEAGQAARMVLLVPIGSGRQRQQVLAVVLPRQPLFPEDDQSLLNLMCRHSALILEQKGLIGQLREQNQELVQANQELEAFAYSVSHDLRTPLRHIEGFAELLNDSSLSAPAPEYLARILGATGRMAHMIDVFLSFSRLGRAELALTRVPLAALVAQVQEEHALETRGRQVSWTIGPLPDVLGDPVLLRQAWMNLIGNALKYTRTRATAQVEIGTLPGGADGEADSGSGYATIYIRDNGVGFDPAYAGQLFTMFGRLHHASDFEGDGLGLAVVRRIVRRHNGRVWAEGRPDSGATFYVTLRVPDDKNSVLE